MSEVRKEVRKFTLIWAAIFAVFALVPPVDDTSFVPLVLASVFIFCACHTALDA